MIIGESASTLDPSAGSTPASMHDCAPEGVLLRAVIDTTPECIKIISTDGRVLQMNAAGLAMIEAESWRQIENTDLTALIVPEDRERWRACHARVCAGEHATWEYDIVGFHGTRRHMETHAAPIEIDGGTIGQLAITRDITARKNAEASLHEVNEVLTQRVGERTQELEQALVRLKDSERSLDLFVNSVVDYA